MNSTALPQTTNPSQNSISLKEDSSEIAKLLPTHHPKNIIKSAEKELANSTEKGDVKYSKDGAIFKALTLYEFENGALLSRAVAIEHSTLAIDMMIKLQEEFNATTISEKAYCELAAISYTQMLYTQTALSKVLNSNDIGQLELTYISLLSKEKDRAVRHYDSAIQNLRIAKQPRMNLTVKHVDTVNMAEQQVVQSNK